MTFTETPFPGIGISPAREWAREKLFSSPANTALTVVAGSLIAFILYSAVKFIFIDADWTVIDVNRRLIFLGRYPQGEEWRVWPPMWLGLGLGGLTYGLLSRARE